MGYKMVENVCVALTVAVCRAARLSPAGQDLSLPRGLLGAP